MNNEPVAWINRKGEFMPEKVDSFDIPLYTHPVKELTDEEIMNIFDSWSNSKQEHNLPANNQNYFYQEMFGFARAILRKANEK